GLLHGRISINVDDGDLRTTLAPRTNSVRHHIDLRVHRVRAPDDNEIGLRHLARIGPGELACPRDEPRPGRGRANGRELARVALGMAQALDAVAHDEAHGSREEVWPD